MLISNAERKMLRLNLQFFGDDGNGDPAGNPNGDPASGDPAGNPQEPPAAEPLTAEAIEKLVQSRVDKITAELGKKNSTLQKELEKLKREKLSEEEIKKLEIADKEKALTEKENALLERENRLYAIKAIKEIGLDDGSQNSLDLVDFVMATDEDTIKERVTAFKALVDRFVTAKVDETFKANGRVPNGGNGGGNGGNDPKSNIAVELGKKAAEVAKKSNEILEHYYGG